MSSIVTEILSSTVGLLVNKARDSFAAKLTGSDVTHAKVRELVVKELVEIKTKLDGLSRKDLLSSYTFLKQGINLLNASLKKLNEQQDVDKSADEQAASTTSSSVQSEILNEALALSQAMEKLNIVSDGHFDRAKEQFKDAGRSAVYAFSNEALSIEDRLVAAKLRIVATILECLESPEDAITLCWSFLEDLHGLKAIVKIFSVYLKRRFMLKWNNARRVECVKSVMLINYTLFEFMSKFSREYRSAFVWPSIKLKKRSFNPILHWQEVSRKKSMRKELTQLPNVLIFNNNEDINPKLSAVNSHGHVVGNLPDSDSIKIIPKKSKSKVINLPVPNEDEVYEREIKGLAVDRNNNVYVVSLIYTDSSRDNSYYVLDVLDENYNVKQTTRKLRNFKEATEIFNDVKIAFTKNNHIVKIQDDNSKLFVCDNTGKLKHTFERDSCFVSRLGMSGQDEIMIPSDDDKSIQIYSEKENLKSTIKLPKGHKARSLAFNYAIDKVIVLAYVKKKDSYFLLSYTESGELETEMLFCKRIHNESVPEICSHPKGPCVIVRQKSITLI